MSVQARLSGGLCSSSGFDLGKLPVVPVGDTGTIPYSMRQHAADYVGAALDRREEPGDGGTSTLGP